TDALPSILVRTTSTVSAALLRTAPGPAIFPYATLFRSPRLPYRRGVDAGAAGVHGADLGRRLRPSVLAGISNQNARPQAAAQIRSEEHTSELQSLRHLVCRLLLEKNTHNRGLGEPALPA